MDIVFAGTRFSYQSYSDFDRLVKVSGFEFCYVDQIDLNRECIYITTPVNGELRPHVDHRLTLVKRKRCKIIWWSLERPDLHEKPETFLAGTQALLERYVDEVWCSDLYLQKLHGRIGTRFVPFGSDRRLCDRPPAGLKKIYDIIHLSAPAFRRQSLLNKLSRYSIAPNGWGGERHEALQRSTLMLNVHKDEWKIGEPLRVAVAAAYGLPLLSEEVEDPYPLKRGVHAEFAPYDSLPDLAYKMLSSTTWVPMGERLRERLCDELNFERVVRWNVGEMLTGAP